MVFIHLSWDCIEWLMVYILDNQLYIQQSEVNHNSRLLEKNYLFQQWCCYNSHITPSPKICHEDDNKKDEVTEIVKMYCFCLLLKFEHYTVILLW